MTTNYLLNFVLQDFYRRLSVDNVARFRDSVMSIINRQSIVKEVDGNITYSLTRDKGAWQCVAGDIKDAELTMSGAGLMRIDGNQVDGNAVAESILSTYATFLNESGR